MNLLAKIYVVAYAAIVALFLCCALFLIAIAGQELWYALLASGDQATYRSRFDAILESIGLLTIAVASLELSRTVLEEEIVREVHISAPTRVRRFLSRFLIVVVVSLSIECLVAVFQLTHKDPSLLPRAAMIGVAAAALLIAWGVFLRQNKAVEELEPEAMREAQAEDRKVQ